MQDIKIKPGYKKTEIGVIPEDWDIKNIELVCKISTGGKNTQDKISDGKYPFYVRSQKIENINSYSFDGEAVLTAGDGVGTGKIFHYVTGKFDYHQRVYKMSNFKNVDGYFFYLYFSNYFYNRVMQMTAKSSVDSVRLEMISEMNIPIPKNINEQKSIAQVLSDTDELITSLGELINKKEIIKESTIQELLNGKRRLTGFCGKWEEQILPNICWFQEGPGLRNWQFTKTGMKVINVTNLENGILNLNKTDRHISIKEFNKMYKHFEIDSNDIVVASSGNSYGKVAVVRKQDLPLLMNTSVIRFKEKNIDYNYLLIFLKSKFFKEQIDLLTTGGAQPNFGPFHLNKILINLPLDNKEQKAISNIISDMYIEIEELKEKRNKYKQIKEGMMQELLTGKIRLV